MERKDIEERSLWEVLKQSFLEGLRNGWQMYWHPLREIPNTIRRMKEELKRQQ